MDFEKRGLGVEDEWRKIVRTGISLLLEKERAIDFEVHCWKKREKIHPTEINRLSRKCWERGDKELHLNCGDPWRCLISTFKGKSFAGKKILIFNNTIQHFGRNYE